MNRTELKAAIAALNEKQMQENRQNCTALLAIQKKRDGIVRSADDTMREEKMQENIRHREASLAIEAERQQLFYDYKAQKSDNKEQE